MRFTRAIACAIVAAAAGLMAAPAGAVVPIGGGRGPRPVAPSGWAYVWVTPTYRTVTTQTWVPERTELVPTWMETSPGHFEQVWRQVVTPGHYETSTRQVLVSDGHWELVRIDPPPIYISPPIVISPPLVVRNAGTVGVEGYGMGTGEDLHKFSGLSEWPK